MKNTIFGIDDIYKIVKNAYMNKFPYGISFNSLDALNLDIKSFNKDASIEYKNDIDTYSFSNPKPTEINKDAVFYNDEGFIERAYEEKLEGATNDQIISILEDCEQLEQWLQKSGFIAFNTATEKMLACDALIKN
ncbi:hypothetical protein [Pantoea ananatis]|uniref:hypothetical protein n=1 Tax=Pantoea TaxID=53335 RepID=UPI00034CCF9C|nr:hypothetical protein [Pantoea ananatis]AMB73306.1 hypothetical protein AW734_00540 [Pantoea ananatis]URL16152.1 hypothetical protein LVR30_07950 [Pantoea ananatis]